jgi:hypothetical protein
VIFRHDHVPGQQALSDFTDMADAGVSIAGQTLNSSSRWSQGPVGEHSRVAVTCRPGTSGLAEVVEKPIWPADAAARRRREMPTSPTGHQSCREASR